MYVPVAKALKQGEFAGDRLMTSVCLDRSQIAVYYLIILDCQIKVLTN